MGQKDQHRVSRMPIWDTKEHSLNRKKHYTEWEVGIKENRMRSHSLEENQAGILI